MRKIALLTLSLLRFATLASAQIPTAGNVFFGYSYYNTNLSPIDRANTNGWQASVEGKFLPWGSLGTSAATMVPRISRHSVRQFPAPAFVQPRT